MCVCVCVKAVYDSFERMNSFIYSMQHIKQYTNRSIVEIVVAKKIIDKIKWMNRNKSQSYWNVIELHFNNDDGDDEKEIENDDDDDERWERERKKKNSRYKYWKMESLLIANS